VLGDLVLTPLGLSSSRLAETPDDMRATVFAGGHGYHPGWAFHGVVAGPVVEAALALHRLLHGDLLASTARSALLDRHPIGGPIAGRPWVTTGYGLGLMMGTMRRPGMPRPLHVVGHSAGGPGSVGAVYHLPGSERRRTAACFTAGQDEGVPEDEVLRQLETSIYRVEVGWLPRFWT
jgi:D-alanyl-D-alanine carboxypeptidase